MKNFEKVQFALITMLIMSFFGCTKTTFIETPQVFTNNMVLQQKTQVKIWGKADAEVKLTIEGSWGASVTCKCDENGNWMANLPTIEAGGPFELSISSGKIVKTFENVMLGEVWICSGQSNMEMPLISNWAFLDNAALEVSNANYPDIRLFTVQKNIAFNPIDTLVTDGWLCCDTNTVKNFSATAYFFGRKLYQELGVPIGLIHTSWGGTVAEAWTSKNALLNLDDFAETVELISSLNVSHDSLELKFEADTRQMNLEIMESDPGYDGENVIFTSIDFDDSDWFPIDIPKMWEETALGNYDGSTWFRKDITLSPQMANSELTLCYGAVDDWDEAWMNGVKVGENKVWDQLRKYKIPDGVAKVGKNTITIRIYDNTGGGGFRGEAKDYNMVSSNGATIPIAKGWVAKKGFDFKDIQTKPISLTDPNQPTVLFNGMINPLLPYTIQGAIWYQGESNSGRAFQYRELFKTLITDWREQWKQGDFPFLFVQLANYLPRNTQPVEDTWAELREAQVMALDLPNTGMAVTIDIGNALDIHPGNKQEVGNRLALNAMALVYEKEIAFSGPIYSGFEVSDDVIELSFNFVYDGLSVVNGSELKGFSIAGTDSIFVWADAKIVGNKVRVSSPKVKSPLAVRYAWSSNPDCNLINSAKLPASPFRTDIWKGITQ